MKDCTYFHLKNRTIFQRLVYQNVPKHETVRKKLPFPWYNFQASSRPVSSVSISRLPRRLIGCPKYGYVSFSDTKRSFNTASNKKKWNLKTHFKTTKSPLFGCSHVRFFVGVILGHEQLPFMLFISPPKKRLANHPNRELKMKNHSDR